MRSLRSNTLTLLVVVATAAGVFFTLRAFPPITEEFPGCAQAHRDLLRIRREISKLPASTMTEPAAEAIKTQTLTLLSSINPADEYKGVPHSVLGGRVALSIAGYLMHRHSFPTKAKEILDVVRNGFAAWTSSPTGQRMADRITIQYNYVITQSDGEYPPPLPPPPTTF